MKGTIQNTGKTKYIWKNAFRLYRFVPYCYRYVFLVCDNVMNSSSNLNTKILTKPVVLVISEEKQQ